MTYSPIAQTPIRRFTHALIHRAPYSLKDRCAQSPVHRLADLPNHPIAHSADRHVAYSLIRAFTYSPKICCPRSHPAVDDPSGHRPHLARGRAPLRCAVSYLDRQEMTMPSPPARPSDNRPSGETAIGIPIAYPAISKAIGMAMVPEAPMLLRVFRQSNSDHRLIGCDPRRRNSTIAIPIA